MLLTRSRVTGRLVNYGLRSLSWTMRANPFQRLKKSIRCATYLNIGCGKKPDSAFTNLDLCWYPGVHLVWNLKRPLPFTSSTLAGIYTEHCFEHLPQPFVADVLLKELHRCLRPNGIVRIIVPDGELFVELYHSSRSDRNVRFPSPGSFSEDLPTPMMHVNRIFRSWDHLFAYDFETLAYMLGRAGFVDIQRRAYREGADQKLLIDSPERREESLRIEARAMKTTPT
jgi:predicted SAM-dependent methyltransferase